MSNIISKIRKYKTDTIMIEKVRSITIAEMKSKLEMKHEIEYVDNMIYTRKQKKK